MEKKLDQFRVSEGLHHEVRTRGAFLSDSLKKRLTAAITASPKSSTIDLFRYTCYLHRYIQPTISCTSYKKVQ